MPFRRIAGAVAGLAVAGFVAAAPLQTSESVTVGSMPSSIAVDPRSGTVLVGNAGSGRGGGSLAILERDGRLSTIALAFAPARVAVSPSLGKAIAIASSGNDATIVDLESLRATTLATAGNAARTVIVERTGMAYVLGNSSHGALTAIDLRTHATRVHSMPGFVPEDVAASAEGDRLFVLGAHDAGGRDGAIGFIQAFDAVARAPTGIPVRVGRVPRHVVVSPRGDALYVVGHAAQDDARPAIFVLSPATLATDRVIELPQDSSLDQAEFDPDTGRILVLDRRSSRLLSVDPVSGAVRATRFESPPLAFALDRGAGTAIVSLNAIGQAAIVSRSGVRLDTVPIGRAPKKGEPAGRYAVAVDAATGDAYLTNGPDGSIAILRHRADPHAVVNLTDVWFDPDDPGWGLFMDQQGVALFATLFTHDAAGDPTWFVMSGGLRQPDGSFAGMLFRTRGPATLALGDIAPVGIMRITPETAGTAKLVYVVNGRSTSKTLRRFLFDAAPRPCGWSVGTPKSPLAATNFTSLWSDPREQGWGVGVSHQGNTAFAVLFSYDAENRPSWAVMSNGKRLAPGVFAGDLYRAGRGRVVAVGTMTLDFAAADQGSVAYRVDGLDFRAPIARQAVAPLVSRCAS